LYVNLFRSWNIPKLEWQDILLNQTNILLVVLNYVNRNIMCLTWGDLTIKKGKRLLRSNLLYFITLAG
jgi:hypothetical protein